MHHDPSDLGSVILFRIIPKEHTLEAYRQRQISQPDCEITSNCGKNLFGYMGPASMSINSVIGISKSLFLSEHLIEDMVAKRDCFFPYPSSSIPKRLPNAL